MAGLDQTSPPPGAQKPDGSGGAGGAEQQAKESDADEQAKESDADEQAKESDDDEQAKESDDDEQQAKESDDDERGLAELLLGVQPTGYDIIKVPNPALPNTELILAVAKFDGIPTLQLAGVRAFAHRHGPPTIPGYEIESVQVSIKDGAAVVHCGSVNAEGVQSLWYDSVSFSLRA